MSIVEPATYCLEPTTVSLHLATNQSPVANSTLSTTANLNLTGTSSLSGTGTIDLTGAGSKARFDFAGYGTLPTASTYVGMYAYDSTGNRPYYSSGSGWVRVLDENYSVSAHTDVNTTGIADGYVLKWDSSSSLFVPGEADASIAGINTTGTSYFNDGIQ